MKTKGPAFQFPTDWIICRFFSYNYEKKCGHSNLITIGNIDLNSITEDLENTLSVQLIKSSNSRRITTFGKLQFVIH